MIMGLVGVESSNAAHDNGWRFSMQGWHCMPSI